MKNYIIFLLLASSLIFLSNCKKPPKVIPDPILSENLVINNFSINIPNSLSQYDYPEDIDSITGNQVYSKLKNFLYETKNIDKLINAAVNDIYKMELAEEKSFNYMSQRDQRTKHVSLIYNVNRNNTFWDYELLITDKLDGDAFQVVWNNSPVLVHAVMFPKNFDRSNYDAGYDSTYLKIEYSEGNSPYTKQSKIYAKNLPIDQTNEFSINNIEVFIGETTELTEIYGNTNHPNTTLIDNSINTGFNWAFSARYLNSDKIAAVKLGLPPSNLIANDSLFTTYSVYNVLHNELLNLYPTGDSTQFASFLSDAGEYGFYDSISFKGCDRTIDTINFTNTFLNMSNLIPFAPNELNDIDIFFYQ